MLMMIALVMIKRFPISMSIFVEWIKFVKTCHIGMIDFVRSINMIKPNWWLKVIDEFATRLCSLHPITCELCNRVGHLNFQCMHFHDQTVSKYCDDLISRELYNELCLFLWCEELSHKMIGLIYSLSLMIMKLMYKKSICFA